jgi:POT family proton-dependent oligopeptide transporter
MTPIFGAIAADQYFGRLRTIIFGAVLYMIGLVVLVLSSLPVSQESSLSFPGILTAMLLIGMGTGGLKSNVSSLVAEQYKPPADPVRVQSNGERVILDTDMTIQRYVNPLYEVHIHLMLETTHH